MIYSLITNKFQIKIKTALLELSDICMHMGRAGLAYRDTEKLPSAPVCLRSAMAANGF